MAEGIGYRESRVESLVQLLESDNASFPEALCDVVIC